MRVVGLNPHYDFWYYSEQRYIVRWLPLVNARKAIIKQYLAINEKIKKGEL